MKRLVALLLAASVCVPMAQADELPRYFGAGGGINFNVGGVALSNSNPIPVQNVAPQSVSQANITSLCAAVPNSSTAVTLTAAATTIDIYTSTDADILHVNWTNGTATTSNAAIYPGGTYRYQGTAISAFKVIGEGTSGHYNVVAK